MPARNTAPRIALALTVGLVAMVAMSSSMVAAIVGGLTIAAVMFDVLMRHQPPEAFVPASSEPTPTKLSVDLRERRP